MIRTKTMSVTSGKGGVGKTTLTCNLAYQLAQKGNRVLILDGDWGMANVDVFFGVRPRSSIADAVLEMKPLDEIICPIETNLDLLPGGSGVAELQNLDWKIRRHLLDEVSRLNGEYDFLIVDTAPGISDNVLALNMAVEDIVLLLTPDPSSFTDAYALIKVLRQKGSCRRFLIVTNMVRDPKEGVHVFRKFSEVAHRFLDVSLDYVGAIPLDPQVRRAHLEQNLVLRQQPFSSASVALSEICRTFDQLPSQNEIKGGLQFFWQSLVGAA